MAEGNGGIAGVSAGAAALHEAGVWRELPEGGALVWLGRWRRAVRIDDRERLERFLAWYAGLSALLVPLFVTIFLGRSWLEPALGAASYLCFVVPFALLWVGEARLIAFCRREDAKRLPGPRRVPSLRQVVVGFGMVAVLIALRSSFDEPALQAAFRLDERGLEAWLGALVGMGAIGSVLGLGHAAGAFGTPMRPIFDPDRPRPGYLPMPDGGAVVSRGWPLRPMRLPDRDAVLAWASALVLARRWTHWANPPFLLGCVLLSKGGLAGLLLAIALATLGPAIAYAPVWRIHWSGRGDPEAQARLPPGSVAFDDEGSWPWPLLVFLLVALPLIAVAAGSSGRAALALSDWGVMALLSGAFVGLSLGFAWGLRSYAAQAAPVRRSSRSPEPAPAAAS